MSTFELRKTAAFTPRGFTTRGDITANNRSPAKEAPKRAHQFTNTSAELTGNSNYVVSKLAALPNALQAANPSSSAGVVNEKTNHSLLITDQSIYVWKYNSNDAIPTTTQLPVTPLNNGFPPLALLVSPSAGSTEPGVVVINSHTGHIRFYENIESASAVGLLHQRKGLEFQLKLSDRELISIAEPIEPAGILMSTTTGRVILLSLRDSAGNASLTTSEIVHRQASFFSTSVALHKQISSIKAGSIVAQGERIAAMVTRGGKFQVRACARDGQSKVILEQELSEILIDHIQQDAKYQGVDLAKKLSIVDMALLPHFEPQDVFLLLASLEVSPSQTYYIQFVIRREQDRLLLFSAYRIRTYSKPYEKKPELYVPAPGSTAFIVFDNAVVLAQLPTVLNHELNNRLRKWEDIITFRSDVKIIGCGPEDIKLVEGDVVQYPSVHVMIPQVGVLRVERLETSDKNIYESSTPMLKTHIEQAVFYGESTTQPLDFDIPDDLEIDNEELKNDILSVANEILSSASTYLPPRLSSLESHLELRLAKSERLLHYAASNFADRLDEDTKISLVTSYEKIVAGLSLQKVITKYSSNTTLVSEFEQSLAAHKEQQSLDGNLFLNGLKHLNSFLEILFKKLNNSRGLELIAAEIATQVYSSILAPEDKFRYGLFQLDGTQMGQNQPWFTSNEIYVIISELFQKFVQLKSSNPTDPEASQISISFTEILFYALQQKIEWLKSKKTKSRAEQEVWERDQSFLNARSGTWTQDLVRFGAKSEALAIAETYKDLKSLVEISEDDREHSSSEEDLSNVQLRFDYFFQKFGYAFAETLYNYYIQTGKYEVLLFAFPQYGDHLERFFSENDHGKISWVNDLLAGNYNKASSILYSVTKKNDEQQSHRHLQLSIAKLSALSDTTVDDELLQDIQEELDFVEAQEGITSQINAFIRSDSDPAAQVDAVVNDVLTAPYNNAASTINRQSFQRALSRLLSNKSLSANELIDVYTLLNSKITQNKINCFYSLKVLHLTNQPEAVKIVNEKMIWRRAILSDDWFNILGSGTKTDEWVKDRAEESVLFETLVNYFRDELFTRNNDYQISLPDVNILTTMDSDESLLARYKFIGPSDLTQLRKEIQDEIDQINAFVSDFDLENWIKGLIGTANTVSGAERVINYSQLTIENV